MMKIEYKNSESAEEMGMHREVINETCRDFHGIINEFKVRDYIEKNCSHLNQTQRKSLQYHLLYSRDHDKTIKAKDIPARQHAISWEEEY